MKLFNFKSKIFKAGAALAFFSLTAKAAGLLRDRILASHFGAGSTLDIYYSAFKIPDLIFNLVVLGAVSSALIPVFLEHYRVDREKAWRLAKNFLNISFAAVSVSAVIVFVFAGPLSAVIAPGFSGAAREILKNLLRVMLLSSLIFSLSAVMGSVLQALERFLAYSLAPIFYNAGIIVGALYFAPWAGSRGIDEIYGLGAGVVFGALLHLAVQLPPALAAGFRFGKLTASSSTRFRASRFGGFFDFYDDGFRKIFRLLIPRTLGLGAFSAGSAVINALASTMAVGSITAFNFANNLQFVPISVLGISVATVVFPKLSFHAAGNEKDFFLGKLKKALRWAFLMVAPLSLAMFVLRREIIGLIFTGGAFGGRNAELTASVLGIFMLGVIGHSLVPVMTRAFYALQNTKIPVTMSVLSIFLNIILGSFFTFVLGWGIKGLALSFSIAGNFNFLFLYVYFKKFFRKW